MEINDGVVERFMSKVKFFDKDKCWEWNGYLRKDGYANFWIKNSVYLAHRISYFMANGTIPKKMCVCHSCDNRRCVNPEHLWIGTQKDNMRDCANKGRIVNPETEKQFCKRGHPLFGDNLKIWTRKDGLRFRKCRTCAAIKAKEYREKEKWK